MDTLIAASIWTHPITSTLLMLLGFGLVVFIHELGHFLVAKAVNIRVEQFALGFGKKLWGFTWGETEYRLNILPLGGYVKMLGQEDFAPAEQAEQDPRAFNQRPIWARMAVVAAGVVMNVVLAAVLFFVVFSVGKEYIPAVVGGTAPGYPASRVSTPAGLAQGLQPGDTILAINGDKVDKYDDLVIASTLAGKGQRFTFTVRRPGVDESFDVAITPARGFNLATRRVGREFGVVASDSRTLIDGEGSEQVLKPLTGGVLTGGETIVSFAGQPIEHGWQIARAMETLTGEPVEIAATRAETEGGSPERVTAMVQPELTWSTSFLSQQVSRALDNGQDPPFDIPPVNVLGLQPRLRIRAVIPKSPAEKAGIQPGDVIAGYARDVPTIQRLRKIGREHRDSTIPVQVLRTSPDGTEEIVSLEVKIPDKKQPTIGVDTGGLDEAHLVVAGVLPGSPLAGRNLIGSTITAVNGTPVTTWRELIGRVAALADDDPIVLGYLTPAGGQEQTEPIAREAFAFDVGNYGYRVDLPLQSLMRLRKSANPVKAFVYGVRETRDFIVLTYATLHGFFTGRVSGKEFHGPIGIFQAGITVGERGPIYIVWLLAIISANLAVINFLPLPIVDGGHAVLLLIEKARGKPLSVAVQNVIQAAGLALIVTLFVLLTYNDIVSWIRRS